MAVVPKHGKTAAFGLDSTAGSLVMLSSGLDDISISRGRDNAEVTNFGDNDRNFILGLKGGTISISGQWSSTHAELLDGVFNSTTSTTQSFEFSPSSTAAGNHNLKGECLCTSLEYGVPVDDKVTLSAEFAITGAVTSTNH